LNDGLGVAQAHEVVVCAEIHQEFESSPFARSILVEGVPAMNVVEGPRTWRIEPFPRYSDHNNDQNNEKYADFYIARIDQGGKDTIPTMIEAKRAYLLGSNPEDQVPDLKSQIPAIEADIKKLRHGCTDILRGYILIWSIATNDEQGPFKYLERLNVPKPDIRLREVRQIPLYVSKTPTYDNSARIDKWLWVALCEVTKRHEEKGDPKP